MSQPLLTATAPGGMTYHQIIARACLVSPATDQQRDEIATAVLAELRAAGLVIMPAIATHRMRHEASKATAGINAGTFAAMWERVVVYARTLEGPLVQHQDGATALREALRFYADRASYNSVCGYARPVDRDLGRRARESLAGISQSQEPS